MKEFQSIETTLDKLDVYDEMAKKAKCSIEVKEDSLPIVHNYYKGRKLIVSVKCFSECP